MPSDEKTGKDPMEIDAKKCRPSPEDTKFIKYLSPDLQAIANDALEVDEDAANRLERLEVQLRERVLGRIRESSSSIGDLWKQSLSLCVHLVFMSEETEEERYKGLNARKIPFVLLEDIFDCLSAHDCKNFWHDVVLEVYETLFGQRIWSPSPTLHPCWLPFLKITNKLIRRLDPKDSAPIMLTLCRVYPLAERSSTRAWGSHNSENVTSFEAADEFEDEQSRIPSDLKMDEEGSVSDYSFYESFWKLQEDLNHPNAVKVAEFLQRLKTLISALESNTASPQAPMSSRGVKYLTSSHLMSYQLTDPDFRIHILTQILIVCHHLSSEVPVLRTKLIDWQNRSKILLKNVGADGPKHLALLESVLGKSEEQWRQWKKNKCQGDLDKRLSQPLTRRKRRRSLGGTLGASDDEDESMLALTQGVLDAKELATASKQMRISLPDLDPFIEDYVAALDPEGGVEAEYHPKNDKLFSWRALRLLSRDHVRHLHRVHVDGDFEGMVRHVHKVEKNVDIPGDYPDYHVEDFEEKEEEEEEEEEVVVVVAEEEDIDASDQKYEKENGEYDDDEMAETANEPANDTTKVMESSKTDEEAEKESIENKSGNEASFESNAYAKMDMDHEEEEGEEKSTGKDEQPEKPESIPEKDHHHEKTKEDTKDKSEPERKPTDERERLKFTPPPHVIKEKSPPRDVEIDKPAPRDADNGQMRVEGSDAHSTGRRITRGAGLRNEPRSRGPPDRRGPPPERGPPPSRNEGNRSGGPRGGSAGGGGGSNTGPASRDGPSGTRGGGGGGGGGGASGGGGGGGPRGPPVRDDHHHHRGPPQGRDDHRGPSGRGPRDDRRDERWERPRHNDERWEGPSRRRHRR